MKHTNVLDVTVELNTLDCNADTFADEDAALIFDNIAEVTAESNNVTETFCVQMCGAKYRPALGCLIYTSNSSNVKADDYPEFDLGKIIAAAEKAVRKAYKAEYYGFYYIIKVNGKFLATVRNTYYINADSSPYQLDWEKAVFAAKTRKKVKKWIDKNPLY